MFDRLSAARNVLFYAVILIVCSPVAVSAQQLSRNTETSDNFASNVMNCLEQQHNPHAFAAIQLRDNRHPAVLVVALAELDGLDRVVEPLEGRARLLIVAEAQHLLAARDR